MKKLLHERLRVYANSLNPTRAAREGEGIVTDTKLLKHFADEIERYYIPRPRFEDGEPLAFGKEFVDGGGKTHILHEIDFRDKEAAGLGAQVILRSDTPKKADSIAYNVNDGEYVKRPQRKEQDSLEKIYNDMMEHHENWDSDPNEWLEMATRLSALIEKEK